MICDATLPIDDMVAGILLALDYAPRDDGQIKPGGFTTPLRLYNVGNNPPEQLVDLIGAIERMYRRRAEVDMPTMQDGDVYQTLADIDDVARDLSIAPINSTDVGFPLLAGCPWQTGKWPVQCHPNRLQFHCIARR